ncbi:MAG: diguanylate cyclase (GGDEF)-like protein [Myxococcota bacterium]|jgi:diguanylate cyclase (GGDEF)-like protein
MQAASDPVIVTAGILIAISLMLMAAFGTGWLRLHDTSVPRSPLATGLQVTLVGCTSGTFVTGIALALQLIPASFIWPEPIVWLVRPEALAGISLLALICLIDGELERSWMLVGAGAAATTVVTSLWWLKVIGTPSPYSVAPIALCSGVISSLLLSPGPTARFVSRMHRNALEALGDHVVLVDPKDNIIFLSKAGREALGLESRPYSRRPALEKLPNAIRQFLDGTTTKARLRTPSGRILEVRVSEIGEHRRLKKVRAVIIRDFTGEHRGERRLMQLAHYDSLTGLANRRLFLETLTRILDPEGGAPARGALFYLDLDGFKAINDSLGHAAGDELLKTLSDRLRDNLRPEKTARFRVSEDNRFLVARLAGDEFAVIAPSIPNREVAGELARLMIDTIRQPIELTDRTINPSASIGVAIFPDDSTDVETLLHQADSALYVAKSRGRQRHAFYEPSFDKKVDRARQLEEGLRTAIRRNELRLHYQPKLDARNGEMVGLEALLRWKSHELGDVGPAEFIPVAEERGLINELGTWCLDEACRQLRRWTNAGLAIVPVAVNVSSLQFAESDLQRVVSAALKRNEVEPHQLEIELTESLLLGDGDHVVEVLADLRSIGVRIALDDFGTGYSSLSYLNRFHLDVLKMDRSLLRDIDTNPSALGIASAVVSMAHSLGLSVVAEGIDMEEQLPLLDEMGCDHIQGFLFAPGLPAEDVVSFLGEIGAPAPTFGPGMTVAKVAGSIAAATGSETETLSTEGHLTSGAAQTHSADDGRVLLIDDDHGALDSIAQRLDHLGINTDPITTFHDSHSLASDQHEFIRLVAFPASLGVDKIRAVVEEWSVTDCEPPHFVIVGEAPGNDIRAELREIGVDWALWSPFSDTELRYVVSSAMSPRDNTPHRSEARIPVDLMANVWCGGRREVAVVSTLSPRGAFIEVSEPMRKGSSMRIEIELAGEQYRGFARVAYVRTDESQRTYEPTGVGVTFYGTDREEDQLIRKAISDIEARFHP